MTALLPQERIDNAAADLEMEFRKVMTERDKLAELCAAMWLALDNLTIKLRECTPAIDNAFAFSQIHGFKYTGPTYEKELLDAHAVLTKAKGVLPC